jgi:hypothetical protein
LFCLLHLQGCLPNWLNTLFDTQTVSTTQKSLYGEMKQFSARYAATPFMAHSVRLPGVQQLSFFHTISRHFLLFFAQATKTGSS